MNNFKDKIKDFQKQLKYAVAPSIDYFLELRYSHAEEQSKGDDLIELGKIKELGSGLNY